MSKAGARLGGDTDTFGTPPWTVHRLLDAVELPTGQWLEPCAGAGGIVAAVNAHYVTYGERPPLWTLCELQPRFADALAAYDIEPFIGDFHAMTFGTWRHHAVAITNPPFPLAQKFIERCLPLAYHVLMLLRLNFAGSAERQPAFRSHLAPDYIHVLPDRPQFSRNAKGQWQSDSCEYSWWHWTPERSGEARMRWLDTTPLDVRQRQRDEVEALYRRYEVSTAIARHDAFNLVERHKKGGDNG